MDLDKEEVKEPSLIQGFYNFMVKSKYERPPQKRNLESASKKTNPVSRNHKFSSMKKGSMMKDSHQNQNKFKTEIQHGVSKTTDKIF